MEEMLIGGYTLEQLKEMQKKVKKDASKVISENVDKATKLMDQVVEGLEADEVDTDAIQELVNQAASALDLARIVSMVSGVEFYLPSNALYDDAYSSKLEDYSYDDTLSVDFGDLLGLLEDMEYQTYQWNNSNCY